MYVICIINFQFFLHSKPIHDYNPEFFNVIMPFYVNRHAEFELTKNE